ncbi:CynX/NimT family MFS transporter [Aidingimonas lacisalsi]|uniref:CynX/NimT family MFS transporter n=1 Tax=Aidingimonas lacisalsi TaxID=2604086 RepID=UPI001F1F896E|nr:MFS transporter [Aidingimonas lacisalsi]
MPGFVLLMVLVGLNLRPALSSLSPVLNRIQDDTALTALGAGALTTLPVLCLGFFAPTAPWLAKRLGPERTLSFALAILAIALFMRGGDSLIFLYSGTVLAGASIGVCGTLLPALVKRELPKGADVMTGVYTMALCLGGALGAGLSIPLSDWLGSWQRSLASWSLIALLALIAWWRMMPQQRPEAPATTNEAPRLSLWRHPLAWQVTGLMGAQSSLAYIVFGWLPVLMQRRGLGEAEAGSLLAISVMVQLIAALGTPWLARLGRDQRPAILLAIAASLTGLLLLLLGPLEWRWWGIIALGLGQGGSFSMALTLIALRSGTSRIAGKLSSMAQGIGYCLAAMGPLAIGIMLDIGAGLNTISAILVAIAFLAIGCALFAGRNRRLEVDGNGLLTMK